MGDKNPIRTLGDYSKPSHEGYRNSVELLVGNKVVPLRSDTIRLVQNGCSFHGLRSEDPNEHLKDFLKLVDLLDLDGENKERTRLRLFQFSLRDQASNWLELLPAGSITIWEDLTTRFLAQLFPPGRTAKLRNDILIFQQHHGESLSEAWTRFKDLLQKVPHYGIDLWLQICSGPHETQYCMEDPEQAFVEYASSRTDEARVRLVSDFMASQDARLSKFEDSFKQQQSEMTNKINTMLKAITNRISGALPSDTVKNLKLSTTLVLSARSYPKIDPQCSSHPSTSINAIKAHFKEATISQTSRRQPEIEIEPQQPEEPEPTLEDEFHDLHLNLPVLEVLAHSLIYNVILDKYVESFEIGKNGSALGDSKPFDTLADLGSCVNIITLYLFKKLNIGLLEETNHIFGLADITKSYPIRIVKDVEVHIGKLKLLKDLYVIDMKKDPETPLLVGRGFLATANAVIDYRMAKIAVGEGITRSVFRVKGVELGKEEAPYWTTLGKRESYKPRPLSEGISARTVDPNRIDLA
ncbi:MAK10-like protein [Tanacetum coccineum]